MESATITTRTLAIDGMTGEECVQRVTRALKSVRDVSIQSVSVGAATIAADQAGCDAACAAIGAAGFKTHEGVRTGEPTRATRATPKSHAEPKGGNQSCTAAQNSVGDNAGAAGCCGAKGAEHLGGTAPAKPAAATI